VVPIDLTPFVGQRIPIEWSFTGVTDEYMGWYIEDVAVTRTTP
jgi:hypothetical protein